MQQELNASYDTIYETTPGTSNVAITTQPESLTPNTVKAELLSVIGKKIINNIHGIEGELCFLLKNTLKNISFIIDENGNLIVNAPDANNYSIDANGYLIYTYR